MDRAKLEKELSALAQAAGFWNERTKAGIKIAVFHENQANIQFMLDSFERALLQDDSRHPFLPDPEAEEVSNGKISFGKLTTGTEVLNPIQNCSEHTLVTGPSGTGKSFFLRILISQLIKNGICCHIWDTQSEYSDLARQFDSTKLDFFDYKDTRSNPFDSPRKDITQKDWVLGYLTNSLRESLFWRERTTQLFRDIVLRLFESGIQYLTPAIFVSRYEDLVHPKSAKRQSEFASLQRLAMMLRTVECFQCDKGEQVQDQLQRSRIIDIREAPDDVRKFLIADSVAKHFLSRDYQDSRKLDLILLFDETAQFFSQESLKSFIDHTESFYIQMLRMARKFGIGIILSEQVYSNVHKVARADCLTKIVFETRDSPSRWEISRDFSLDKEQQEFLGELSYKKGRRAVVQLKHLPKPFLIEIPDYSKAPGLSTQELKARRETAKQKMKWIPVSKPVKEEPRRDAHEDRDLKILGVIACHPYLIHGEYAKNLGYSTNTFTGYVTNLIEDGLLMEESVRNYIQGADPKIRIPTEKALELLDKNGITYGPAKGHGSHVHQFWQYRIWRKFKDRKDCVNCRIEASLSENGKQVDVGIRFQKEKVAYEIAMGPKFKRELENLRRDLEDGWDRVVFCVEDETARKYLDEMIPDSQEQAEIKLLKEFYERKK